MRVLLFILITALLNAVAAAGAAIASLYLYEGARPAPDARADVGIVLGAGLDSITGQESRYGIARAELAAEMYLSGRVGRLLITGGNPRVRWIPQSSYLMRQRIMSLGVPASAILIEPHARTTFENIRFSRAMMRDNDLETAIVITSGFHMLRSRILFWYYDLTPVGVAVCGFKPRRRQATTMAREAAAYPLNLMKMAAWWALGVVGVSEQTRSNFIR